MGLGYLVDEILAALQVLGDLVDIVAIGLQARFGLGDSRLAVEQRQTVAIRQVTGNGHAGERQDPDKQEPGDSGRSDHLNP